VLLFGGVWKTKSKAGRNWMVYAAGGFVARTISTLRDVDNRC
jgi:hypothetical protein